MTPASVTTRSPLDFASAFQVACRTADRKTSAAASGSRCTPRSVRLQGAVLAQPLDAALRARPLLGEKAPDRVAQPRLGQPVQAVGRLAVEAARLLVVAAGARLEARETARDAVFDGRVVADLEVQVAHVARRAPVAPVEHLALHDVERARDGLVAMARDDETQTRAEAFRDEREELAVQILPSPGAPAHGREIEAEHRLEERVRDLVARERLDAHAALQRLAPLAANLIPPPAAKARQPILDARVGRGSP